MSESERLARIETKIDVLIEGRTDQEARIRDLERKDRFRAGWLAGVGAAGAAIGSAAGNLTHLVTGH